MNANQDSDPRDSTAPHEMPIDCQTKRLIAAACVVVAEIAPRPNEPAPRFVKLLDRLGRNDPRSTDFLVTQLGFVLFQGIQALNAKELVQLTQRTAQTDNQGAVQALVDHDRLTLARILLHSPAPTLAVYRIFNAIAEVHKPPSCGDCRGTFLSARQELERR